MTITRRRFAQLGMGAAYCLSGEPLLEQGLSTHSAKPLPRSAHSGRPFHARLVDVAREAGLRAPVIYGGVEQTKYIVETTRSEEHTSELQSRFDLVCRLLLEKKKKK